MNHLDPSASQQSESRILPSHLKQPEDLLFVELFAGSKTVARAFRDQGWRTLTIDNNPDLEPDICCDIRDVTPEMLEGATVIWASPPCTVFSVAGFGRGHFKDYKPQTVDAEEAIQIIKHTLALIEEVNPVYWFMENPRGLLRKMDFMAKYPRDTVTYCMYGHDRMKPTDIFGRFPRGWKGKNCFHFKDNCPNHVKAPRGSRTGIQGMGSAYLKAIVPYALGAEIAARSFVDMPYVRATLVEWL